MRYLWFCCFLLGAVAFWKRGDRARARNTLFITGLFLLVCAAARVCLLFTSPAVFSSLSFFQMISAFCRGVLTDAPVFALFCGPFLLLLNLPCTRLGWQKFLMGISFFFIGIVLFILAGDVVYFRLVGRHTGADIWNLIMSFSLVCLVVWTEYKWALAAAAAAMACLTWLGTKLARKSGAPRRGPWLWELLCLLFLAWTLCGAWRGFSDILPSARAYHNGLVRGHLAQNGVFSMLYSLFPNWYVPHAVTAQGHPSFAVVNKEDALREAVSLLVSAQETAAEEDFPLMRRRTQFNADARGFNLVILVLESLDYDMVDALAGTAYGATPNLDGLIREGISFDNFYSCGMASSLEGLGALMSGVCRLGGMNFFGRGLKQFSFTGLGELFSGMGYKTVFVRAAWDDWMFIGPLARLMGFTSVDEKHLQQLFGKEKVFDGDALLFLAQEMKNSNKPFLGFFFSSATHEPFSSFLPSELDEHSQKLPAGSYLRALAYTDWAVGRFVADLKAAGLYEHTVFIIVGDHPPRTTSEKTLRNKYRVPFVIVAPGVLAPAHVNQVGGQADLIPTLADLFHLPSVYSAMGGSLLDTTRKDFTFISFMGGDHFGLITPETVVLEEESLLPLEKEHHKQYRLQATALDRAVYELLIKGAWAREKKT